MIKYLKIGKMKINSDMKPIQTAIVVAFHKYTPFGGEFYEPILDFFLQSMKKYESEYDKLYLLDSTWNIDPQKIEGLKAEIIKVDPHLRYYDAYKSVLPQIKEHLVLFLDNDMIIYREGIIKSAFDKLKSDYDVVSIYDTIGEKTFPQLNNKSKFCPYFFATGTFMLKDFLNIEWGPNMPEHETLGKLTEEMLRDDIKPFEMEEDKSNCLFDSTQDNEKSKNLGYYHIRAGSTPAYLLATKKYGDKKTYEDYMVNQPRQEYLRQFAWYYLMTDTNQETWSLRPQVWELLKDIHMNEFVWMDYFERFKQYHGL